MSEANSTPKPNPNGSWAFPSMPFAGTSFSGQLHLAEQAARTSFMALELMEAWLAASRQSIDLWRTSVRQMQDGMLVSYRKHVVETLAQDLIRDSETPAQSPSKRRPPADAALAKPESAQAA